MATSSSGLKSAPSASSSSLPSSASSAGFRRFVAGGLEVEGSLASSGEVEEGLSKPRLNEKAPENNGFSTEVPVEGVEVAAVVVQIFDFESAKEAKGLGEVLAPENGFRVFCDELKELKPPSVPNFVSVSPFELAFATSNGFILAYELNPNPFRII